MCGRARCTLNPQQVARACGIHHPPARTLGMECFRPTYNASPGSYVPVAALDGGGEPVVRCMKWGLVPSFTSQKEKPDHFRMFNARSESLRERVSFRHLLPKNRCLVAAEGYYEWTKGGSKKQPYYIHFKDHRPLVFAALYDNWVNSEGEILPTFTILTTSSSSALQWLHDRMPVIFGNETSMNEWLTTPVSKLDSLLSPYEASDLVWYPVTPAMGKVSFDGPECIKEIQLKPADSKPISNFFSRKTGDFKVHSCLEVQNPVEKTSKLVPSESLKESISEDTKEADTITSIKKEISDEDNKGTVEQSSPDRVVRESQIPEIKHVTGFVTDAGKSASVMQKPWDPNNLGQLEVLEHHEREDLEDRGVKRAYDQIDQKPWQPRSPTASYQTQSAAKKKARCVKKTGDGQSSLLSFFGKK